MGLEVIHKGHRLQVAANLSQSCFWLLQPFPSSTCMTLCWVVSMHQVAKELTCH